MSSSKELSFQNDVRASLSRIEELLGELVALSREDGSQGTTERSGGNGGRPRRSTGTRTQIDNRYPEAKDAGVPLGQQAVEELDGGADGSERHQEGTNQAGDETGVGKLGVSEPVPAHACSVCFVEVNETLAEIAVDKYGSVRCTKHF